MVGAIPSNFPLPGPEFAEVLENAFYVDREHNEDIEMRQDQVE